MLMPLFLLGVKNTQKEGHRNEDGLFGDSQTYKTIGDENEKIICKF